MAALPQWLGIVVGAGLMSASGLGPTAASSHRKFEKRKVTFSADVAPILYKNCVECHRPGQVAPFSLIGFENAKKWSTMCSLVASKRQMPPWKATRGYGEFRGERGLTAAEIETLRLWSDQGSPRGEPSMEPKPPTFASEWKLGSPDIVLQPEKAFHVSPGGDDVYRNFTMKVDSDRPLFVKAMDVRAGNPRVVHHVIVYLDNQGVSQKLVAKTSDGQPGYTTFGGPGFIPDGSLGGWAPGLQPNPTPEGVAFKVAPHCTLVLQVHYHPDGKPETDRTRIALYTAKEPIRKEMQLGWLLNFGFYLPPGDSHRVVSLDEPISQDVTLYGVMPHMHLLGKSMKAYATLPDRSTVPLVEVKDWDFNWQMTYGFKKPIKIPKGSKIHVEAVYDNSAKNPRNPNHPPKPVHWGEQTTDEMFLLVAGFTVDKK